MRVSIHYNLMIIILFMNYGYFSKVDHTKNKHQQHHKIYWLLDRSYAGTLQWKNTYQRPDFFVIPQYPVTQRWL